MMDESNKDQEQHELEKLRRKKMKALLEAQKRQQANQERVISINDNNGISGNIQRIS